MAGDYVTHSEPTSSASSARAIMVLLMTSETEVAERLARGLDGDRFDVRSSAAALSPDAPPDVIVTDQSLASDDLAPFQPRLISGEIGVLLIGRALPADVVLPSDFTRRELRLAVRMLAQVVTLRRQQRRLMTLVGTDSLTGLPNRRAFEEQASAMASVPHDRELALALLDLDDFKRVNREEGYVRGDGVLRGAAKTLAARGQSHFVARLGGDEFVLLWHPESREVAIAFVDELRRAIGKAASLIAERPVSASAGIAFATTPSTWLTLVEAADAALRQAKGEGGKRVRS